MNWQIISGYITAAVFAAIWVADLFYFHQLSKDEDLVLILGAAASVGLHVSYVTGKTVGLRQGP